jgi:hypothetical protein
LSIYLESGLAALVPARARRRRRPPRHRIGSVLLEDAEQICNDETDEEPN